jgi:hypothetical protein
LQAYTFSQSEINPIFTPEDEQEEEYDDKTGVVNSDDTEFQVSSSCESDKESEREGESLREQNVKVYSDGNQRAITSPVLSHPWDYSI